MGTLIASVVFAILGQIDRELLLAWVWRVPFLASIFLIAVAVFIRLRMQESPTTFLKKLEKQDQLTSSRP